MEVTVEQSGSCEATVAVTVPWEEFQRQVERTLRKNSSNVRMKGFRAGKVPLAVLERQFGEQARNESLEHFLGEAFQRAIRENDLKPVGQQQVVVDEVKVEEGQFVQSSFHVSLRPEITLGEYKGLEVESELEPVLDQEVEAALADLRRQRSRLEPAGDEGCPEDGVTLCKVRWEKDGEVLLEREGLRFSPTQPPTDLDPDAFRKAMIGARPGDVHELAVRIPAEFEREELRGQEAVCRLEVDEAYRVVPPTDEELRALVEVDSQEALEAFARRKIGEAKQQREEGRIETLLIEGLLKAHDFELPARMVERQVQGREQGLRQQLTEQGAEEAQIEQELEAQRPEMQRQTELGVRAFFLVHALAEKEGIRVTQQDLQEELRGIAARNQASFEEVRDYYAKNRLVEQVGLELLERKVRRMLRENARVVQPS